MSHGSISRRPAAVRLLPLFALVFLIALPSQAQKRRSVRVLPPASSPTGQCHTFNLVRAGLVASYLTTAPSGNVTFVVTYIYDNGTQTKTTQKVTTPQGNADAETILDGEVIGSLRTLKHLNVKTTTTVPVIGKLTTTVDVTWVPSLAAGPASGWCVGATWDVAPSVQTLTATTLGAPVSTITTTAGSQGEVLAVGESITVPGGTFNTVKYKGILVTADGAQPAITWVSMADNIVVKQDTLDAAGNVTTVTQLTALQ